MLHLTNVYIQPNMSLRSFSEVLQTVNGRQRKKVVIPSKSNYLTVSLDVAGIADWQKIGDYRADESGEFADNPVVREYAQVLRVRGDLGDRGADGSEHLAVLAFKQAYNELKAADECTDHLGRGFSMPDA